MEVDEPQSSGVKILWSAHGPTDAELLELKPVSLAEMREYDFSESCYELFIPSSRALSQDTSKIRVTRVPSAHPRWMVITIPFHDDVIGKTVDAKLTAD